MLGVDTEQPQIAMFSFLRHLLTTDELEKAASKERRNQRQGFCIHNEIDKVNTS